MENEMTFETVWKNLTQHEVDDRDIQAITHVRSKKDSNGEWHDEEYQLHYYSWSACWRELMDRFPNATYEFSTFDREGKLYDVMYYADTSASVHCKVTINGVTRDMWLPVMDYKNKAVKNPDARAISDTKMRCLVKTIAMFGLGLDIYEGKYTPTPDRKSEPLKVFNKSGDMVAEFDTVSSWIRAMAKMSEEERAMELNIAEGEMAKRDIGLVPVSIMSFKLKTELLTKINNLFDTIPQF